MSSSTQCRHDELLMRFLHGLALSRLLQNGRSRHTTLAITLRYAHLLQAASASKLATHGDGHPRRLAYASCDPSADVIRSSIGSMGIAQESIDNYCE
jgi:hypothetical protein